MISSTRQTFNLRIRSDYGNAPEEIRHSRLAVLSVLFLCALIIFAFAPGHMDADVLGWLRWIKFGGYTDWYPLFLPCLLKFFDAVRIGPVGVLTAQVLTVGLCAYAFLAFFWRPGTAAIGTFCVLLCPAVLGYLGAITSHGILTASVLGGFTGLLYLTRPMASRRWLALLVATFVGLTIVCLSRQNGLVFAFPGFYVWLALLDGRLRPKRLPNRLRSVCLLGGASFLVLFVAVSGKDFFLWLVHPAHLEPAEPFMLYDISAISLRAHRMLLDQEHFPDQKLVDLQKIFRKNNPDTLVTWGFGNVPPLHLHSDPKDLTEVARTWRGSIAMYPGYYLTERYQMIRGLLGLDFHQPPVVPFHPGIDANRLGYHLAHVPEDALLVSYLRFFQNTWFDRPFIYFVILMISLAAIAKIAGEFPEAGRVVWSLVLGSFLNVAGYFFVSPSDLLRYIWPSIVVNLLISAAAAPYYLAYFRDRVRALRRIEKSSPA